MNTHHIRSATYAILYGDKETFWIGFESVEAIYGFNPPLIGTLGTPVSTIPPAPPMHAMCNANLLHLDESGRPFWLNGGLALDKTIQGTPMISPTHYIVEPARWRLKHGNFGCVYSESLPVPLSARELDVIDASRGVYLNAMKTYGVGIVYQHESDLPISKLLYAATLPEKIKKI
jgi:hypothetical protein